MDCGGSGFQYLRLKFPKCYIDLIDWSNCVVTEPPLTMHIKDKDLKEMCKEKQFPALTFEEFPSHTQSVERCVKLISEAAMKVCGETARYGYIRAQFQARKELPTFDNKKPSSTVIFLSFDGAVVKGSILFGYVKGAAHATA
ncbi:hypothetical protein AVEN_206549-1 [Araneus ventricosus]|uniref:Uncharacterized protein n=1 Tax=Araneus ventricosus TaxID=182803 RepID=A0A4Y2VP39_ARAVE|nr:hypothetical protein AVEN_206549-1 [Araneus ventricosus]